MIGSALSTLRDRGIRDLGRAVCGLTRAKFERVLLGRRFVRRRIHDYQMHLDLEDRGISRTLILFGTREVEHRIMLQRIVRPGMRIFDIGANIGYYALMELRMLAGDGEVVCIEPSPANVELLRRNLAANGYDDVPVRRGAVSARKERRLFHLATMSNLNTFHDTGSGVQHLSGESIEVQTWSVPDLADEFGAPDLIRMDVEGHEVEVIEGMLPAIREGTMAPNIIFETHNSRYGEDHDMRGTLKRLFEVGYVVPLLASSSERGTELIERRGYRGSDWIPTDGVRRKIFEDVAPQDAADFICDTGARTVLVSPTKR